jgi:hypothetical protein
VPREYKASQEQLAPQVHKELQALASQVHKVQLGQPDQPVLGGQLERVSLAHKAQLEHKAQLAQEAQQGHKAQQVFRAPRAHRVPLAQPG